MALPSPTQLPPSLRPIAHYLKTASEYETRDPVITYWCRLAALQAALKLDKKSPEAINVLVPLMDWLEKVSCECLLGLNSGNKIKNRKRKKRLQIYI